MEAPAPESGTAWCMMEELPPKDKATSMGGVAMALTRLTVNEAQGGGGGVEPKVEVEVELKSWRMVAEVCMRKTETSSSEEGSAEAGKKTSSSSVSESLSSPKTSSSISRSSSPGRILTKLSILRTARSWPRAGGAERGGSAARAGR